jgi:hypothetical protein
LKVNRRLQFGDDETGLPMALYSLQQLFRAMPESSGAPAHQTNADNFLEKIP